MKKIEELITKLSEYSHVEQQNIHELLDYIEGTASPQQLKKTEVLLKINTSLAQIIKGIQIYYALYGDNSYELINYLQRARKEGFSKIKD